MVFVETTHSNTKRTGVECRKEGLVVSPKKINVVRETGDGYGHKGSTKVLKALLSTTYHQGPTGMAGLGHCRRARQPTRRADQATQAR